MKDTCTANFFADGNSKSGILLIGALKRFDGQFWVSVGETSVFTHMSERTEGNQGKNVTNSECESCQQDHES